MNKYKKSETIIETKISIITSYQKFNGIFPKWLLIGEIEKRFHIF